MRAGDHQTSRLSQGADGLVVPVRKRLGRDPFSRTISELVAPMDYRDGFGSHLRDRSSRL
jgi:hypothetical protein